MLNGSEVCIGMVLLATWSLYLPVDRSVQEVLIIRGIKSSSWHAIHQSGWPDSAICGVGDQFSLYHGRAAGTQTLVAMSLANVKGADGALLVSRRTHKAPSLQQFWNE